MHARYNNITPCTVDGSKREEEKKKIIEMVGEETAIVAARR